MLLLLTFIILQLNVIRGGFVLPDKPNPIVPYSNNELAFGEYSFYMTLSNRIISDAHIEITFPQEFQYTEIVKIPTSTIDDCPIQLKYSSFITCPSYTLPTSQGNIVLSIDPSSEEILSAGSYQIIVKYITNPSVLGGLSTGNFKIRTLLYNGEVDSNDNFGQIGFAPQYMSKTGFILQIDFKGLIINDGSNLGGHTTNYIIQFTTSIKLLKGASFRLQFAQLFDISKMICILVDTQQNLECQTVGSRVIFAPLQDDLLPGNHKLKLKSVINTYSTGESGTFIFETLLPFVNTVVEYYSLNPVVIQPGSIINPQISGYPLNRNLRIDYTILFTPMNNIPLEGKITFTFPIGYQLDPSCRIIYGLNPAQRGSQVSCVSQGLNVLITSFSQFNSQEICFKIYAVNPPLSQIYGPFIIKSYSNFDSNIFKQIDENLQAGFIQISEIQSPYFVGIDLYRKIQNLSLDTSGPIDFRIFPMFGKELSLSPVPQFAEIYIQIPLWWRIESQTFDARDTIGSIPICMFGDEPSSLCQYNLQVFRIRTPYTTTKNKYPENSGLGSCDVPISISEIRLPPIPGRYDFRVMTLQDDTYLNFLTRPLEQDLFTMEIQPDPFPTNDLTCTSKDLGDLENLCYASLQIGLAIPQQGAINFNMSTVNDILGSSSAWSNDLGFGLGDDQSTDIPCSIIINSQVIGIPMSRHPNVKCYVFSGSITRPYTLIQIRGFSSLIAPGSQVEIVIPNVQNCIGADLKCIITLSSSYTTDIDEPYILNLFQSSTSLIIRGSISKETTLAGGSNPTDLMDITLLAGFDLLEICNVVEWTFTFKLLQPLNPAINIQKPDHILLKFPRNRFIQNGDKIFQLTATSSIGSVTVIDNYADDIIYYFIIVEIVLPLGSPVTFTLGNIRNPLDFTPGIDISMVYWQGQRRIARVSFPTSDTWTPGGITSPRFQILPKYEFNPSNREEADDMEFNSPIDFMAQFILCHEVNVGGLIEISRQTGLVSSDAQCKVWSGVSSAPSGLGYEHQCNLVTIGSSEYYHITGFNRVPPLTQITISFRGTTGPSTVTAPPINIKTYFSAANRISSPSDTANINDYHTQILPGIDILGPNSFPNSLAWKPFINSKVLARLGDRGEFYVTIQYSYTIPSYNIDPDPRLVFNFPTAVSCPATPHCRIDGFLVQLCTWVNGVLSMSMPPTRGMTANTPALIMISTRGADGSGTLQEGLTLKVAGTFQIDVNTADTGNNNEFTYIILVIKPKTFRNFWVWASNKIGVDPVHNNNEANMALYRIFFNNPILIPPSNNPDPVQLILEFYRVVPPNFDTGFESDLGTGQEQRYDLPCIQRGFKILPGKTKPLCRLIIGSYPNPTRIIITDFDRIVPDSNCEIHIPNIFNPPTALSLIKIGLIAQLVRSDTGETIPLLSSTYDLVNITFGRVQWAAPMPVSPQLSVDQVSINVGDLRVQWPTALNPEFGILQIDTMSVFTVQWASLNNNLGGGSDCIIFLMPELWNLPYADVTCTFPVGSIYCISYPNAHQIVLFINSDVPANTLQTGTIVMRTPPYKILISANDPPIKIYIHSRSKIVDIWSVPYNQQMDSVEVSVSVENTYKIFNQVDEYIVIIINDKNIPSSGAMVIRYPSELQLREKGCRNDIVGGSQLAGQGFRCDVIVETDGSMSLLLYGFSTFIGPGKIRIKVRLQNPETEPTGIWSFETFYLKESVLNKKITYGNCTTPSLQDPVTIAYWETSYRSQTRSYALGYGSLDILLQFGVGNVITTAIPLQVLLPFNKIRCSQFLCLWNFDAWYFNDKDTSKESKCTYNVATTTLTVYPPFDGTLVDSKQYRLTITSQNSVDGIRGLQLPIPGTYDIQITGNGEQYKSSFMVPSGRLFTFFESYSLVTNSNMKNMVQILFTPQTPIPAGGKMVIYLPTITTGGDYLFEDDLGSGVTSGQPINCYRRSGFMGNVFLNCILITGNKLIGKPAKIEITGSWTLSLQSKSFTIDFDQIINPTVTLDNRHIEVRMESYDAVNVILDSGISYDFTVRLQAVTELILGVPLISTYTIMDTNVVYSIDFQSPLVLEEEGQNDYFVLEFPQPMYGYQPYTITCRDSQSVEWSCYVSQGNGWVVIRIKGTIAANTNKRMTISGCYNPVFMPSGGVILKGYTIKSNIVIATYSYTPITTFVQNTATDSAPLLTLQSIDLPFTGGLSLNVITRFQVSITVSLKSQGLVYGNIIYILLPIGFTAYPNCYNDINAYSQLTVTLQDNLDCQVGTISTKQYLSFTGFDPLATSAQIKLIMTVKTPTTLTTGVSTTDWKFMAYKDNTRALLLFEGSTEGPVVNNQVTFADFKFSPKYPQTVRKMMTAPFIFSLSFPNVVTKADCIVVSFPALALVSVPTGATLTCTFSTTTQNYAASACTYVVGGGVLDVSVFFPDISTQLTVNTNYEVKISTIGGEQITGLTYNQVGRFTLTLTQNTDVGTMEFEVLPIFSFVNANIKVISQLAGTTTTFIVSFITAQILPMDGKIVLAFPIRSLHDDTIIFFNEYLFSTSTGTEPGNLVKCYTSDQFLYSLTKNLDCRIYKHMGKFSRTIIVLSNFPADIQPSQEISFVIEDIQLLTNANSATIPLELYTVDKTDKKIEAKIFYDWISPVPAQTGYGQTMSSLQFFISSNYVQQTDQKYTFAGIVLAQTMTLSSMIVIKFPALQHDLSQLTLNTETPSKCYRNSQITIIGNYVIYKQLITGTCTGTIKLVFVGAINAISSSPLKYYVYTCFERACEYQDSTAEQRFLSLPGITPIYTNLETQLLFPYSSVLLKFEVLMDLNLPAGSKFIIFHPTDNVYIDRIEIKTGLKTFSMQRSEDAENSQTLYELTLNEAYFCFTDLSINVNLWARLKGNQQGAGYIFDIGVYTRFQGFAVTEDANYPRYFMVPPTGFEGQNLDSIVVGKLGTAAFVPGVINTDGVFTFGLPAMDYLVSNDSQFSYLYDIYFSGLRLVTNLCTLTWLDNRLITGILQPDCMVLDIGHIQIQDVPYLCTQGSVVIQLGTFQASTAGVFGVSVLILKKVISPVSLTQLGIYTGHTIIFPLAPQQNIQASFKFSNANQMKDNVLTVSVQYPTDSGMIQTMPTGSMFIDVLSPIANEGVMRKLLCMMNNAAAQCTWIPRQWASDLTTSSVDGFQNLLNPRILVVGYKTFSSSIYPSSTIQIAFDMAFTQATTDFTRKYFSYGYYMNSQLGNEMQYKFGQSFYLDTTYTVVTPLSESINFNLAVAQSLTTYTMDIDFSSNSENSITASISDYIYIKFKKGYLQDPILNKYKKLIIIKSYKNPLFTDPTSIVSASSDCYFKGTLMIIECKSISGLINPITMASVVITNIQLPFMPTINGDTEPFATMYIFKNNAIVSYKNFFNGNGATQQVAAATLTNCQAIQRDRYLFYFQFQLPTSFVSFNENDCVGTGCTQNLQIYSSALDNFESFEISCGLNTALISNSAPMVGAYTVYDWDAATNIFSLNGYSQLKSTSQVCLWIRTNADLTAGLKTFDISIKHSNTIVMASCSVQAQVAAQPTGSLIGLLKNSQFGYLQYQENQENFERNSLGYLVFRMGFGFTPTLGGKMYLKTSCLDLLTFDMSIRLRCFFRDPNNTGLSPYSPVGCLVDRTNQQIIVPYSPTTALSTTKIWELVIMKDQNTESLMTMPQLSLVQNIFVSYVITGGVQASTNVFIEAYEKKANQLKLRTFISSMGRKTVIQVSYTVGYQLPSETTYIQLEFPLKEILTSSTTAPLFAEDLGTGIVHGGRIECVDKIGNLGLNYFCTLLMGIDTDHRIFTSIRLQNLPALGFQTQVSFNLMNIIVPTSATNQFMPLYLRVADRSGQQYEYIDIQGAIFTQPLTINSAVRGSATINPPTTPSISILEYTDITPSNMRIEQYASVLFTYDVNLFGDSYTGFTAIVNNEVAEIDAANSNSVFITFPSTIAISSPVVISFTGGILNPNYPGSFTSSCSISYLLQGMIQSTSTADATIVLVTNSDLITFGSVVQSSQLKGDSNTLLQIPMLFQMKAKVGNTLFFQFPIGFTIIAAPFCKFLRTSDDYQYQVTRTITSTSVKLVFNEKIAPAMTSFQLQVTLPSTSGNYIATMGLYSDTDRLITFQEQTSSNILVQDLSRLNASTLPIMTSKQLIQVGDSGPIRLTIIPTQTLLSQTHYLLIDDSFLGTIMDFPDNTTQYILQCYWNDRAAYKCIHDLDNNQIRVYTPISENIQSGTSQTVLVTFYRTVPFGQMDFRYLWTPLTPIASITDRYLQTFDGSDVLLETFSKTVVRQNYPFDVGEEGSEFTNFINVHQTTVSTDTLITVKFKLLKAMNSASDIDWGRLILTLPTKHDYLAQLQFPDGIGRFTTNNAEIDCFCSGCPNYADPIFRCKVYLGAEDKSAPVEIWFEPQENLQAGDEFQLSIAKVMLPAFEYTHVRMSLLAITYDSITKRSNNISEIVADYTFHGLPPQVQTTTGQTLPTFTPNFVGMPAQVTFTINNAANLPLYTQCHERWILESSDSDMLFEQPSNPQDPVLFTAATDHSVNIYRLAKWIEFTPTVDIAATTIQTLEVQNLKNMPFAMPLGVNYVLQVWLDGELRLMQPYLNKAAAPPAGIFYKELNPNPSPALVLLPNHYTVIFQPFNFIPLTGKVVLILPNYDWKFTSSYCQVVSGLTDCACDIASNTKQILIQDCMNDYNPIADGKINVQFDIINPSTPQSSIPFIIRSYWNKNEDYLIDQDLSYEESPVNQILASNILQAQLYELYQYPYVLCGGRIGPITLSFNLANGNLYYPNHYIQIDMWNAFLPAPGYEEIICYFTNPLVPHLTKIKSHRCTFDPTTRGGRVQIFIPEEIDIEVNDNWDLTLTSRGSSQGEGWVFRSPSDSYWVVFTTSNTIDKGWVEANIPGCPFSSINFQCENVGWQASTVGSPSWSIFNFTASTLFNDIPTGDLSVSGHSRFLFEFITFNELEEVFPADITGRMLPDDNSIEIACNGLIKGNTKPLQAQGNKYIKCTNVRAASTTTNSTPSYVVVNYAEQISANQRFNLQIAEFMNGYVEGTPVHIKVVLQVQQEDATYYAQNEHWCWNAPPALLAPPSPSTTISGAVIPGETQVNLNMGVTQFSLQLDQNLQQQDVIVIDYDFPYSLPIRGFCKQYRTATDWSEIACVPHPFNLWFVISNNYPVAASTTWNVQENYNFINPPFIFEDGLPSSPLNVYVWRQHQLIYKLRLTDQSATRGLAYIVLQTTSDSNPCNEWVRYHVGIIMQTKTPEMNHIRLWAPSDFQQIRNCKINRGLEDLVGSPITCTITRLNAGDTAFENDGWMIEIDNFDTYYGDGWIIVDMDLLNPIDEQWTSSWRVATFQSITNLGYRIDENNSPTTGGQTWVGSSVRKPSLFRVYRNTKSFYDRKGETDQYAEFHMRVLPHNRHPPTNSLSNTELQVWMPDTFEMPNGGAVDCSVGNQHQKELQGQTCQIGSDRKIFVKTDAIYGLIPDCSEGHDDTSCENSEMTTCQLIKVTTVGASDDGFKLPSVAGESEFQMFIASQKGDVSLREYTNFKGTTAPKQLDIVNDPYFLVDSSVLEESELTIIKLRFTAPLDIPAGYDTQNGQADQLLGNSIAFINVIFNTLDKVNQGFDGFPLDLGQSTLSVLCQGFQQLKPKEGEVLSCTLTPSTAVDINYPAIITVSNFQPIQAGQVIEMHFLEIKNGYDYNNNGQISFSAHKRNADGTTLDLIKKTSAYIPLYDTAYLRSLFSINIVCPPSNSLTIYPQTVGAYTQIRIINLSTNAILTAGDRIMLRFPNEFEFNRNNLQSISSSWNGNQMITTVYIPINTILLEFPSSIPTQTNGLNTLTLSQLRNAAYAFSSSYLIQYTVLKQRYRTVVCSISGLTPPSVAPTVRATMSLSSRLSEDVHVTYSFEFTPSYFIPRGTTIAISLPSRTGLNYNHIGRSDPLAQCILSLAEMGTCAINAIALTTVTTADIAEKITMQINLIGAKNPTSYGSTLTTDFYISLRHPNNFLINSQSFPSIMFFQKRNYGVIYMTMSSSNLFKGVTSNYAFTLQSTAFLPAHGKIILHLPIEWGSIIPDGYLMDSIQGSWTTNQLSFSQAQIDKLSNPNYYLFPIYTQFDWPSRGSITIRMLSLTNPTVDLTKVFKASTLYDAVLQDQTDPLETSMIFTFVSFSSEISVLQFTQSPTNQGEVSVYTFKLSSPTALPLGGSVQFDFSSPFSSLLSTYDKNISCTIGFGDGLQNPIECLIQERQLKIKLISIINSGLVFNIVIMGISNPSITGVVAVPPTIDIITLGTQGEIMQYVNNAATATLSPSPKTMNLIYLFANSTNMQAQSSYQFCAQTDQPVPLDALIYIDFPKQFLLGKPYYVCSLGAEHDVTAFPYSGVQCTVLNKIRRIAVSGQSLAFVPSDSKPQLKMCYIIDGVVNPSIPGYSGNFIISVYNNVLMRVIAKTFGNLDPQSNIMFIKSGLTVIVGEVQSFSRLTSSALVSVHLQRTVPYNITLTPISNEFTFQPTVLTIIPQSETPLFFTIIPLDDTISVGFKSFSWIKEEDSLVKRFLDVPDTFFEYSDKSQHLVLSIFPVVSRTSLGATSLPIQLQLSQPASQVVNVLCTAGLQNQFIEYNPQQLVFQIGQTIANLTYKTLTGSQSGSIQFSISSPYDTIYNIPEDVVNFEIIESDNNPPIVVQYYAMNIGRTFLYFRASVNENAILFYELTLQGCKIPLKEQIMNQLTPEPVWKVFGQNYSYQSANSNNYIYNDIYLMITGLKESTQYSLFFYVIDLSSNSNEEVLQFDFSTQKKYLPAQFKITLQAGVIKEDLIAAFGLITGLSPDRFQILQSPDVYTIPGVDEPEVMEILNQGTTDWVIVILQNPTDSGKSPIQYVQQINLNHEIIKREIPQFVLSQSLTQNSFEILYRPQQFKYQSFAFNITAQQVFIRASLLYDGNLYAVIMPKSEHPPSSQQIRMGLNSTNMLLPKKQRHKSKFIYNNSQIEILDDTFNFNFLYDDSDYKIYLTAENDLPINPDLMEDDQIQTISIKTLREVIVIFNTYILANIVQAFIVMIFIFNL